MPSLCYQQVCECMVDSKMFDIATKNEVMESNAGKGSTATAMLDRLL